MAKAAVLTDEETEMFKKNLDRIGDIINDVFSEGTPRENKDKRMALEAIERQNDGILRLAEIRQKGQENESNEAVRDMVVEMLKQSRRIKSEPVENRVIDIDIDENEVDEILPTALSMEQEELNIDHFIGDEEDEDR